jgi:hypothetical protein
MNFVYVDFIIMDMEHKAAYPIIFGRPLLRTTFVIIDSNETNVKFQFPGKNSNEKFPWKEGAREDLPS